MEPYDISNIEQAINALISSQKLKGNFKGKFLSDYKYQIISLKTTKQKLLARIQAICIGEAEEIKWKSTQFNCKDGGDCYFNFIYDLTDKNIVSFEINGSG